MWNEKKLDKYDKICANYRTYNCKFDRFYSVNVKKELKRVIKQYHILGYYDLEHLACLHLYRIKHRYWKGITCKGKRKNMYAYW